MTICYESCWVMIIQVVVVVIKFVKDQSVVLLKLSVCFENQLNSFLNYFE